MNVEYCMHRCSSAVAAQNYNIMMKYIDEMHLFSNIFIYFLFMTQKKNVKLLFFQSSKSYAAFKQVLGLKKMYLRF